MLLPCECGYAYAYAYWIKESHSVLSIAERPVISGLVVDAGNSAERLLVLPSQLCSLVEEA